jgi:hypothetical protein
VALAGWAAGRLDRLMLAASSTDLSASVPEPLLIYLALLLARTGAVAVRTDLPARLQTVHETDAADVWLWAVAHDIFADAEFKARALAARLPARPLLRGLAMLRLHQLTGDLRWVTRANRAAASGPNARLPERDTALLVAELMSPERAIAPPFGLWLDAFRPARGTAALGRLRNRSVRGHRDL